MPGRTEWDACDRPLGIWACLWAGRAILVTGLEYWDYKRAQARCARGHEYPHLQSETYVRSRAAIMQQRQDAQGAAENGTATTATPGTPHVPATGLHAHHATNPYEANNDQNANEQPINLPYTLLHAR